MMKGRVYTAGLALAAALRVAAKECDGAAVLSADADGLEACAELLGATAR